jgi:hypothetical protein
MPAGLASPESGKYYDYRTENTIVNLQPLVPFSLWQRAKLKKERGGEREMGSEKGGER